MDKVEVALPELDECRILILKIVEQSVRDYVSLERSPAPIDQYYYQTAYLFIFQDEYRIHWGNTTKSLTDLLDLLDLDVDWFRMRVKELKIRKVKQFNIKHLLNNP